MNPLLAVPNVSEGRDHPGVVAIAAAFTSGGGVRLLDVHRDADHHRAVVTLAGGPGELAQALMRGTAEALQRIDIGDGRDRSRETLAPGERPRFGQHPHVGAVDVVPVVHLTAAQRGAACAEALVAAEEIGALGVPVFLYGELAGSRTRAELRRGGIKALAARMLAGELRPDFGPSAPHPTGGAALVGARPPLVAFNLELAPPATVEDARRIAALIREGGEHGLPGVRAIGVALQRGPQVSLNIERPTEVPLRTVVSAVRAHAAVARAELVGLAPAAALEGFPADVPLPGFDPVRHLIENALKL
ncbi:MAG TPA: hypothetical protein VNV42_03850 [Solirubrobacteraceae bacterium]|nr:hypothetical protein [Solirubrobacteraceae bacterium]